MSTTATIEFIVGTYELSPDKRESVLARAAQWAKQQAISSFEGLYNIVARLTDKISFGYVSLDSARNGRPLSEIIRADTGADEADGNGSNGLGLAAPAYTEAAASATMPVQDALEILKGRIPETHMRVLLAISRTAEGKQLMLGLTAEQLLERAPYVCERLDELVGRLGPERALVLPARKIYAVQLNPLTNSLTVRMGKRDYRGNPLGPLGCFNENEALFAGMNRRGFARADPGLSNSVRRSGQIDEALPNLRPNLTAEQSGMIVQVYGAANGNTAAAAEMSGYSASTVYRHWRKEGIPPNSKNVHPTEADKRMMAAAVATYGTVSEAARHLPWARNTIAKHSRRMGVESSAKNGGLSRQMQMKVIAAHGTSNGNASKVGRDLVLAQPTVRKVWETHSLEATGGRRRAKEVA